MSSISLRASWNNRFKDLGLSAGLRAFQPFYKSPTNQEIVSSTARFPYKSMRALIESLEWPNLGDYVPTLENHDYPQRGRPGWNRLAQGVTHDKENWYFSQKEALWKIPVWHDLASSDLPFGSKGPVGIPSHLWNRGYDHFGDLDINTSEGILYVPLEGETVGLTARIVAFSTNLDYLGDAEVLASIPGHQQTQAPWCAINPFNRLLYTSAFKISPTAPLIVFFPALSGTHLTLFFVGHFKLFNEQGGDLVIERVQGGAFSSTGHLYLVSDTREGGIMGFDMITGRRIIHFPVSYLPTMIFPKPKTPGSFFDWVETIVTGGGSDVIKNMIEGPDWIEVHPFEELEGITIWDRDTGEAPNIRGQIHALMLHHAPDDLESIEDLLNFDFENTAVYFKHYEIRDLMTKGKV